MAQLLNQSSHAGGQRSQQQTAALMQARASAALCLGCT